MSTVEQLNAELAATADQIASRVKVGQVWASQSGDRVFRVIGEREQRTLFSTDEETGETMPFTLDSFPVEYMPTPEPHPCGVGVTCFAYYRLMKDVEPLADENERPDA